MTMAQKTSNTRKLTKSWAPRCNPYRSWERGAVENARLVRRYLPKKTDFSKVSKRDLYKIQQRLNNRPRKCLDFKTPNEVFKAKCCT